MKSENAALKWDEQCIVCGKSVGHNEGFSHLNIEGQMIALCCPLCFETFEKDPAKYLRRRAVRKISTDVLPPGASRIFGERRRPKLKTQHPTTTHKMTTITGQ